jgi:4,5-DOPA dioxygenase extradiol
MSERPLPRMPVVFVGHGSPMNIIADNPFTQALKGLARRIPRPRAILCISAHWETQGTLIQSSPAPLTIHDFTGFPRELYATGYKTVGAPALAEGVSVGLSPVVKASEEWGVDHGTWSVLLHMYPEGDIPVTQLSLDRGRDLPAHYSLAQELQALREQGVLILASGNLVHNLRKIRWEAGAPPFDWAQEFDTKVADALARGDHDVFQRPELIAGETAFKQAHPTIDHYLPILYALGATVSNDRAETVYEGIQNGAISMRTVLFSEVGAFA